MPDEPTKGNESQNAPAPTPLEADLKLTPTEVFAKYGIKDQPDTIIDVFDGDPEGKALHDDMVKTFGGPEGHAAASTDLTEAILIADPEGSFGKAIEKMTRAQESQAVREVIAEWRGILATPEKAQAVLTGLYANPEAEPMKSYIRGNASHDVNNAFAKLWQAAHGEKPTGLPPRPGDGFIR